MGISLWKSMLFFVAVAIMGVILYPTNREIGKFYAIGTEVEKAYLYLANHFHKDPDDVLNAVRYLKVILHLDRIDEFKRLSQKLLKKFPKNFALREILADFYEARFDLASASEHWREMFLMKPHLEDLRDRLVAYYYQQKNYNGLIEVYKDELRRNKNNSDLYYEIGHIYALKRMPHEAEGIYLQLLERFPEEGDARIRLAEIYEYTGNIDKALVQYKKLCTMYPLVLDYSEGWIDTLERAKRYKEMAEALPIVIKNFPTKAYFPTLLAHVYMELKEPNKAIDTLRAFYESSRGGEANVLLQLADIYSFVKDYNKAKAAVLEYNRKTGGNVRSYHLLGDVYSATDNEIAGKVNYEKALHMLQKQDYLTFEDQLERIRLLFKLGYTNKMAKETLALLEQHPYNEELLEYGVEVSLNYNDYERAEELIKRLKRVSEDRRKIDSLTFRLLMKENKWEEALSVIERLLEQYPDDTDYLESYADVSARLGHWQVAVNVYKKLYDKYPSNNKFIISLVRLYYSAQQYQDALQLLRSYNEKTGGDYTSYHILGDVYAALGNKVSSRRAYEKALLLVRQRRR